MCSHKRAWEVACNPRVGRCVAGSCPVNVAGNLPVLRLFGEGGRGTAHGHDKVHAWWQRLAEGCAWRDPAIAKKVNVERVPERPKRVALLCSAVHPGVFGCLGAVHAPLLWWPHFRGQESHERLHAQHSVVLLQFAGRERDRGGGESMREVEIERERGGRRREEGGRWKEEGGGGREERGVRRS